MKVSYIAHVSGKVQGVCFRASSQQVAIRYGVSGYARNLADGDVEVLVCGDKDKVEQMLIWLEQGPPSANVLHMQRKQVQWQEHNLFAIR